MSNDCYMYSFKQLYEIVEEITAHSQQTVRLDKLENDCISLRNEIKHLKDEDQEIRNKMIEMNKEIIKEITKQHNDSITNNTKIHKLIKQIQKTIQRQEQTQDQFDTTQRRANHELDGLKASIQK